MKKEYEIGIVGLGTMGRNLLLNMADHGYPALGLDKDLTKVKMVQDEAGKGEKVQATPDIRIFLGQLREPRAILLLVPAGAAVDAVLGEFTPLLGSGDLIIDAGNSHFSDTDRREKSVSGKGFHFFGMGVSGGEEGARLGPSLMPGGNRAAYERVRPILEAVSAKAGGIPCVTYLGPGSAGHYVKMVHNGIEYGLMQLIAETYHLMKVALEMSDDECHEIYHQWNQSELNSYLLEITAQIFLKKDEKSHRRLIDLVLDVAKQTGTGKWTSQDAMELQVPLPLIDAAVSSRDLSALEEDRKSASRLLTGPERKPLVERQLFLSRLRNAYYGSSIITFSQGMALLHKASEFYHYDLNLEAVARIWRAGCIIRAGVLEQIMTAYRACPKLSNLLLDSKMSPEVGRRMEDLRSVVQLSSGFGIPTPGLMASLSYYDGLRSAWLPTNLIQAQRDFFGSHTYERIDETGVFHSDWGRSNL